MNIGERLEAARLDVENQSQNLNQLKESRISWRLFYGELAVGAAITLGEISLVVLGHKVSSDFKQTFGWKAIKAGWRVAETVAAVGAVVLKDKKMSYQIEDAEAQLDWDARQLSRVESRLDDNFLSIYRDYPLAPGG